MKIYYKPFLLVLALGTLFTLVSCQEDENLNLVTYPVNRPSISIDDTEKASTVELNAIYKNDGTLELDGAVTRTYTFHFDASPKDATITYEILATNIPMENVEISATHATLPAGYTDASVTVTLKNEDFSFAASNFDATTYELGVRASVDGYQVVTEEPLEAKVSIKKAAYTASCFVAGEDGNQVLFERAYNSNGIVNPDPISYTFKVQLDKPARKDVKIKLSTIGLDEQFMNDITVNPAEIVIPAGKISTEDITWTITDDFLLQTAGDESHTLVVAMSAECDDPVVVIDEMRNTLTFNVNKVFRTYGYIPDKVSDWVELSKSGWAVSLSLSGQNGKILINGQGGKNTGDIYSSGNFWFMVDMQSEKTIRGFGIDYYENSKTASSPRQVTISTSLDNVTWVPQGTLDTPQSYTHYFQFFVPINARYVKVELSGKYNNYIDLTEIYVYNK